MKYQLCSSIFITTIFFLLLANNNSFAAPDAGTLLKQEKEAYRSYKDPLLTPKIIKKKKGRSRKAQVQIRYTSNLLGSEAKLVILIQRFLIIYLKTLLIKEIHLKI